MSVWKRVRQYSKESVTSIIHGKAKHEETKATTSQATAHGPGHYLVVYNLAETDYVCNYILHGGVKQEFLDKFKGAYSPRIRSGRSSCAVGVANQTTMLRGETEEVQRRIKNAMIVRYGEAELDKHFRFFDTICGATQDRQDALEKLLREPMDLLLVIGGYNSSNTSHWPKWARRAVHFLCQERGHDGFRQAHPPLQPGAAKGSRNRGLAAAGQDHRRHHRGRVLPQQPDRGRDQTVVRVAGISVQELLAN
jgi:4-hydroxy-3-methylbut-2-enyl diphosphate reductase IspH